MTGIFITATGTDCGKTYISQRLLQWDNAQHNIFSASKPIVSGWPQHKEDIQHTDTGILLQAQAQDCDAKLIHQISPWRYLAPLSPEMAAKREGKEIIIEDLIIHCQQQIAKAKQNNKIHLIEGVGGVMAPIWGRFTVLEWMVKLGIPCILITGSYLGSLSHTLTAIHALQSKNIEILAVVVNESLGSAVSVAETVQYLQDYFGDLKIISVGHNPRKEEISRLYEKIRAGTEIGSYVGTNSV